MESIAELFENTGDGVCAVSREQRVVFWNRAAESLLGFRVGEVCGRFCFEVVGGLDESGCRVCRSKCAAIGSAERAESIPTRDLCVRTKAGRETWLSLSTIVLPPRHCRQAALIHLFRDVSVQKALQQGIERLFDRENHNASSREIALPNPRTPAIPDVTLTRREQEVLRVLASGATNRAIAETLVVSVSTVRNHIHNILAKFQVHSRLAAVSLALRNGLI